MKIKPGTVFPGIAAPTTAILLVIFFGPSRELRSAQAEPNDRSAESRPESEPSEANPMASEASLANFPPPRSGRRPPEAPPQFAQTCALCHGGDARGTDRAPSLVNNDHLRNASENDIAEIIRKGKGKMPALPLAPPDVQALAHYVRLLDPTGAETPAPGDPQAGERIFFGAGQVRHLPYCPGPGPLERAGSLQRRAAAEIAGAEAIAGRPQRPHCRRLSHRVGNVERWIFVARIRPGAGQPRPGVADRRRQVAFARRRRVSNADARSHTRPCRPFRARRINSAT
jgi:mono/diheme cytochrome c family protein